MISGNHRNGLYVTSTSNVTVQGNFFGIAANNATSLGNRGDGILIGGSSANTQVGGVIPLGNVSAGNGRNGIEVTGTAHGFVTFNTFGGLAITGHAYRNLVTRSFIGTEILGTSALGNQRGGVLLAGTAYGNAIGDPRLHPANLISGNTGVGVTLLAHTRRTG